MKIGLIFFSKIDFKTKGVDLFSLLLIFLTAVTILEARDLPLDKIKLPSGFSIEIFSDNVPNARSMILSDEGTLFVGTRDGSGKVYAILDNNGDYSADTVITIDNNLNMPNGVALKDGDLYVAEVNRILRYDNIEQSLTNPQEPVIVYDNYPSDDHHGWKFIRFGPDGRLYIPVGAPCNVCDEDNEIYASITSLNPDGSDMQIYAHGVRNSVGFDWHPVTGDLWFTDNGRDWMGDNNPPDELNLVSESGQHFGFPYCHGGEILDAVFGSGHDCANYVPPERKLGPHVAALGMRFYSGEMFPKNYLHQIFIAEHGSWNRSVPLGYRVMLVELDGNEVIGYKIFAEGWLQGDEKWGRPVDIAVMSDGSLLISDDLAGVIYRVSYAEASINEPNFIPEAFALHPNYPNPFNPSTTISYDLPEQAHVTLGIYDLLGKQIKTLANQSQDAGRRIAVWDGTDDLGRQVSAGVYLYRIQAGEFTHTRKMLLLK